ncbi:MAG: hypothetical protein Q7T67_08140, partial [Patulibacter sp.]
MDRVPRQPAPRPARDDDATRAIRREDGPGTLGGVPDDAPTRIVDARRDDHRGAPDDEAATRVTHLRGDGPHDAFDESVTRVAHGRGDGSHDAFDDATTRVVRRGGVVGRGPSGRREAVRPVPRRPRP